METNLEYYKVFREVAKKLSFSAAANSLFVTQPAVSQTITALEKTLGVTLFTRTSKGVSLTSEGEHLYSYVDSALNLLKNGEEKIAEILKLNFGAVTIAAADTISKHYLLKYLEEYNAKFPHIKIKVINRTTNDCLELLKSGCADLAFVNLPIKASSSLKIHKCMKVHDVFVGGKKFSSLQEKKLSPVELAEFPLILFEGISQTRKYINEYFMKNSINIEPEIELGSHDLLLEFSKIGLGLSCVVEEFSQEYLKSGDLFKIQLHPKIKSRHIGMLYSQKIPLSKSAEEFVKLFDIDNME